MRWKSVKDDVFVWDTPGQTLEGVYAGFEEKNFGDRTAKLHTVIRQDGQVVRFWGSTILDQRLERVPKGVPVQIIYQGEGGKGTRRYKNFEVNVPEEVQLVVNSEQEEIPF